jgi:hypothetical protein
MTDFLDLLEADLHVAAERRGRPQPRRHRPPKGAFKAIVALAVIALFVFATARVLDRADTEHPAEPTPTPTPSQPPHLNVVVATEGNPGLADVMSASLGGYIILNHELGGITADPSLGTVVLYRPGSERARETARLAAFSEKIDKVRPYTEAEARSFDNPTGRPDVVVVYGREREQQMLDDPKICAPAGGGYKLCQGRSDEARYSVVYHDGRAFPASTAPEPWWSWASLSPDGKSLLLEQSGECKIPTAWVLDAKSGGGVGVVSGVAEPRGWTTDGRVIVFVPRTPASARQGCGAELDPGLYLVRPEGAETRVGDQDVPRSLDPRTPQDLTG